MLYRNQRRYGYDALRVVCATAVCLLHFESTMAQRIGGGSVPSSATRLTFSFLGSGLDIGSLAVCLFFMLSGALAARTTLRDEGFSIPGYLRHRALRLLPPLWLSWLLICVWYMAHGSFHFDVPAWRFALTVLGLDGYVSYALNLGPSFYYCGEWFYGAIVIAAVQWPLMRWLLRRAGVAGSAALVVVAEALAFLALGRDATLLWRSLPVCLGSYLLGACVSEVRLTRNVVASASVCAVACLSGLIVVGLPSTVRFQLVGLGVFGLVELREQLLESRGVTHSSEGLARARRVLVRASGLTLYFFMWQFAVIRWAVPLAAGSVDYAFGAFDYWGLAALIVLVTALAAALTQRLERGIREFAA